MLTNRFLTVSIVFIMLLILASIANTDYTLEKWTVTTTGGRGNSNTYELFSSVGQLQSVESPAGNATSTTFQLSAGFLHPDSTGTTDTTPPTPNAITSIVASFTQMDITSTEATDSTPPVYYRLDGQYHDGATWGDSGGGVNDYDYSTTRPNPWSDTNLVVNGLYRYRQRVKDSATSPNESAWSDWVEKYTLANTPSAPTVGNPTLTTLDVTVEPNGNPTHTLFAIYNATGGYYVNATGGDNGDNEVWQTKSAWGTVTVTNLTPGVTYEFKCKAKNGDSIETPLGEGASETSLAAELSQFNVSVAADGVVFNWRTETEVGNVGFSIYRREAKDGNYAEIAFIKGAGNSGMPMDYQFTDRKVEPGRTYFYYLEDIDIAGERSKSDIIEVVVPPAKLIPKKFLLLQNYPNPFNPETWIPYQLSDNGPVSIRIYDVNGRLICTLDLGSQKAGYYLTKGQAAYWDGRDTGGESVGSGVYFYHFQAGDFSAMRKMVILK